MTNLWDAETAGLPGRAIFEDRLSQVIATHRRSGDKAVLLLFRYSESLPLDAVRALAERLRNAVRNTDTVAYFDDATFAIILTQLKDSENAIRVADTLLRAAASSEKAELHIHVSAGIAVYPEDASEGEVWLACATDALEGAQSNPLAGYCFYTEDMNAVVHRQRMLLRDIPKGWVAGELEIATQTVVDDRTGLHCASELSWIWNHPVYGLLKDVEFTSAIGPSGLGPALFAALCERAMAATLIDHSLYWSFEVAIFSGYGSVGPLPFDMPAGDISKVILVFTERLLSEQLEPTIAGMLAWRALGGKTALRFDGASPIPAAIWSGLPIDQLRAPSVEIAPLASAIAQVFGWSLYGPSVRSCLPGDKPSALAWTQAGDEEPR
jgi:GGDEF domain-containing protein